MEQFREVFGRVFPNTKQAMPAPIVVHVFGSERAYQPFMPLFNGKRVDVGGYFQQADGAYYITLNTEAGERAYPTIFHEYVHLLVGSDAGRRAGLVQRRAGRVLQHLPDVRRARGDARPGQGGARLDLRERFIPLAELLAVDHKSPLYNEGDRRGVFYAESWALVHYLLIGNPQRKGQLADLPGRSTPTACRPQQAVREAFGGQREPSSRRSCGATCRSRSTSRRASSFTDKVAIDKDWTVDQPSEADGQAAFADLLLALRRPEEAAARAEAALKLAPDHARAQAVLARIRAADGQADAAATLIDRAVKAAGDTDYLPAYYQARLLLRGEGKHAPTVTAESARQALALLAARHDARSRRWPTRTASPPTPALVAEDPKAAMASAAAAFKLSQRHDYALLHARARVYPARLRRYGRRSTRCRARLERLDPPRGAGAARLPRASVEANRASGTASRRRVVDRPRAPSAGWHVGRLDARRRRLASVPVFRVMGAGEVREIGMFEGVECPRGARDLQGPPAVAGRPGQRHGLRPGRVLHLSQRASRAGRLRRAAQAGAHLPDVSRHGRRAHADGVAVAIELLPDDYQP